MIDATPICIRVTAARAHIVDYTRPSGPHHSSSRARRPGLLHNPTEIATIPYKPPAFVSGTLKTESLVLRLLDPAHVVLEASPSIGRPASIPIVHRRSREAFSGCQTIPYDRTPERRAGCAGSRSGGRQVGGVPLGGGRPYVRSGMSSSHILPFSDHLAHIAR